jgi:hypothetical protein
LKGLKTEFSEKQMSRNAKSHSLLGCNMTAGKGNMTSGRGNMTARRCIITAGRRNMTAGRGNMTAGRGNMSAGRGNMTARKLYVQFAVMVSSSGAAPVILIFK